MLTALREHHRSVSKTLSSDESILSIAGSVVVEENVSSESEHSSQDSGVYKNIIINLGNLITPEHTSATTSGPDHLTSTSTLPSQHRLLRQQTQSHSASYLSDGGAGTSTSANNGSNGRTANSELVGILKKSK